MEGVETGCRQRRFSPPSSQELLHVGYKAPYLSRRCAFDNHSSLAGSFEVRGTCAQKLYGLCGIGDSGRLLSLSPLCSPLRSQKQRWYQFAIQFAVAECLRMEGHEPRMGL